VKQLADGIFEVPSDSDYNKTYVVNLTGKYPQCTCTAWAINRNRAVRDGVTPKPCKHCKQALNQDPAATKRIAAQKAQAEADAKAAYAAAQTAEKEKMKAEILKMRADLHGDPKPAKAKPAKDPLAGVEDVLIAAQTGEPMPKETNSLLAQLEAQILANKEKK
jgi:hypothetical protein